VSRRQLFLLLAIAIAALALVLSVSVKYQPPEQPGARSAKPAPASSSAPLPGMSDDPTHSATGASATPAKSPLAREIDALLEKLLRKEATPADFDALRRLLLSADPAQAIAAITAFLKTGEDAPSGIELAIGANGALTGAPTMRVFLMDLLGQIAQKSGSDAAAAVARTVLETKTSPEEWALSMRNVAWHEPQATAYVGGKMREMLAEPAWNSTPSAGFLEAFDLIVFTGDPSFIPQLADLARGGLSDLQRAALMALDRMADSSPLAVMSFLNEHPNELADQPMLRADYYAKADLSQPPQRAALENFLARGDVSFDEKKKVVTALASPASFVTEGLVTPPVPAVDDNARRQAYVNVVTDWVNRRRFPDLLPALQQVQAEMARQ
jgi:hypothetical protein